ncbi:MAG: heat-inducible transcription repressor HrcA [Dehalococcoidales bacterium]|nr:heat-inducible transcription repressor HrcA [Dehalococcoidales bacterium]
MLSERRQAILRSVVEQYIDRAVPVTSQYIVDKYKMAVSSATVRNEMAALENEGFIIRPHTSAGSMPSDKGYRYYVETLGNIYLPNSDRFLIDHLFHQVEEDLGSWLSLAATLLAKLTQNVAVISSPKAEGSRFKHVELVGLQDQMALIVLVLYGARVKQQLIIFPETIDQPQLAEISGKLNNLYFGLTREKIAAKEAELSPLEETVRADLLKMMQADEEQFAEESHLEGWHFLFSQPEFTQTERILALVELAEHRNLLRTIIPADLRKSGVQVFIGDENLAAAVKNYSIVISRYGLPGEAEGTLGVVGPTRMQYARSLSVVEYLANVLTELTAELYGRKFDQIRNRTNEDESNS